jgi:hypothetical protein
MTPNPHDPRTGTTARPAGWVTFVVKAAAFLAIALVFTETLWHSLGYLPAKSDLMQFAKLRQAADGNPRAVALVGSSRVRYGLNPLALERAVPGWRVLQLGILGNSAMPVLEDLAQDPNFRGLAVCEFNPAHWGGGSPFPHPPEALAYMHPKVSGAYLETVLSEHFRERFSFYSYNLFTELPRIAQHKFIPQPERPDRFELSLDLGPTVNQHLIQGWESAALEASESVKRTGSARIVRDVQGWVDRIRRRGGGVAFVRMPVDGRLRVFEDSVFPQTQSLIREVRALGVVVIDFAEMPEHFRCPDGSHLEASEADRFSRLVGQELAAGGLFR